MDRNREAWRGSMAALNGGLSRRRQQRSTNLRDSPEEDGVMETQESSRLRDRDRDRGIKKDRDRDRSGGGSGRSKRRRGERPVHGSNRDDGDDSSEESLDEDDDEEEEAPVSVRFPPPPPPPLSTQTNPIPSSSPSSLQQLQQQSQSNHVRKSFSSTKPARPPAPSWKVAEEMIGVSIPRKARSSSLKRTQECGGGGGSGELIHRQASTSPARPSPSSNTAISPSSSNVSVRKKKPISGSKHRPPKISKSSIQEIEIEVAEVLYGMTRQAPAPPVPPSRQDANGLTNEAKSRVSSPGSFSPVPATSQASVLPGPNVNSSNSNNSAPLVTTAPKRKRPRLKLEDESPTSPATKPEIELPPKLEEGSAPASPSRLEKKTAVAAAAAASPAVDNGSTALTDVGSVTSGDHIQEPTKQESSSHVPEQKEAKEEIALAATSNSKEVPCSKFNASLDEATVIKDGSAVPKAESPREEKFSIDLMAPPPPAPMGNSERDGSSDYAADRKPIEPVKEMRPETANGEMEKPDRSSKQQEAIEAASAENIGLSKHAAKEKPMLDLQLDLEKQNKDGLSLGCGSSSKHQQQMKQQPKAPRIDPKPEKKAQSAASLPLTMPIAGWPGGFPHFGYMGQVPTLPAVMPMDGNSAASKTLQAPHFFPPQKPKRCATHCYIAQTIHYNQQIARMNPFWPPAAAAAAAAAAVGTSPIYGAKQHNLNLVPPSEAAILGNPLQGSFPGRSLGPLQDKASPAVAMAYAGPPAKEKSSSAAAAAANNTLIEAQRKQFLLQQTPQPGSSAAAPNMLHGPAFIFPISQQPAAAAAAVAAAATRSITAKSTPGIGNATPSAASGSSAAPGSGPSGHSTTTMSFNYPGLQPNDTQYLAFLQNNGYPFPIPAHVGGGPSPYRGANPSQAMPFFNGSFYSSPMLHPPSQQQFRQQQQQPPPTHQQPPAHSQQGHQNTSTSSGSSSSQKHHSQQQQRVPGGAAAAGATPAGGSSHNFSAKQHLHLLPPQARQLESEAGCEDSPSTADSSRVSQAQKSIYGNFAMSIHPQNFALISPAAVPSSGGGGGGSHSEKPQPVHNQANLTPSQAYAMSFAPFGGPAAAAAVAAAGGAQGLDFSSMVQNHALFHSLPEAARHHGYQQITAVAAAAAAAQAAQHKKSRHEDGKSVGDPGAASANVACEEGKMMASTGKSPGGVAQHSLSFSRPDNNDPQASTMLGNSSNITEGSSRTLNLIQPPANGSRASNRPSSAAPASNSPVANTANNPTASNLQMQSSQQQQHMIQLQKSQQHQQQLHLQQQMSSRPTKGSSHSSNNATIYSDRMPAGSMSRFSQGALAGLPPSIIQGASTAQSPQWKASGRAATSGTANSATSSSSSAKNQVPQQQQQQQQARNQQQHQQALLGSNMHQTQISFGVSSSKAVGVSGQTHLAGGSSNSPLASAASAAIAAGSPQSAVSKSSAGNGGGGSGSGSPRASSTSKSGPPLPTLLSPALPLHQQTPAGKNSPSSSSSNLKSSSPANNRNMTSILGHPQITPASNSSSSTKFQQQQQQKQSFHQPQLFFSSPYLQAAQSSQPNVAAAAANFYQQQRRQSEQQAHQHSQQSQQQNSTNSGVLSLCPSSLTLAGSSPTSDPAKAASAAATAGVMKGLAPTPGAAGGGILQHNAQYAAAASSMGQHPLMSSSFPYIQTMSSSVSVKPAGDQKAAPGSENLHWKPEKR